MRTDEIRKYFVIIDFLYILVIYLGLYLRINKLLIYFTDLLMVLILFRFNLHETSFSERGWRQFKIRIFIANA
jgi:hypothetical protein